MQPQALHAPALHAPALHAPACDVMLPNKEPFQQSCADPDAPDAAGSSSTGVRKCGGEAVLRKQIAAITGSTSPCFCL